MVAQTILEYTLLYYSLLAVHAIGMAAIVGGAVMLSLRVLGFARGIKVAALERLTRIASWGFLANLISGLLIYLTNAVKLTVLWTFQYKMLSILLGGAMLWILWRIVGPHKDGSAYDFGLKAKAAALATIVLWTAAIIFGRYIAYTIPIF